LLHKIHKEALSHHLELNDNMSLDISKDNKTTPLQVFSNCIRYSVTMDESVYITGLVQGFKVLEALPDLHQKQKQTKRSDVIKE
jgi:hypothetical protein